MFYRPITFRYLLARRGEFDATIGLPFYIKQAELSFSVSFYISIFLLAELVGGKAEDVNL